LEGNRGGTGDRGRKRGKRKGGGGRGDALQTNRETGRGGRDQLPKGGGSQRKRKKKHDQDIDTNSCSGRGKQGYGSWLGKERERIGRRGRGRSHNGVDKLLRQRVGGGGSRQKNRKTGVRIKNMKTPGAWTVVRKKCWKKRLGDKGARRGVGGGSLTNIQEELKMVPHHFRGGASEVVSKRRTAEKKGREKRG